MKINRINNRRSILTLTLAVLIVICVSVMILTTVQFVYSQNVPAKGVDINSSTSNTSGASVLSGENLTLSQGDIIPNEWIITLRENATIDTQDAESAIAALSDESDVEVIATLPDAGALVVSVPPTSLAAPSALANIEDNPNVLAVEPNQVVTIENQDLPTGIDRIDSETGASSANATNSTQSPSMNNSSNSTNTTSQTEEVTVGVIDTGIDLDHPDLNLNQAQSISFINSEPDGDDGNGHGTHVAGTIAAKDDNEGVVGVAPGAELWAIKVLDSSGTGTKQTVLSSIDYAIQNADSLDVINLSLGGPASVAENQAIRKAVASGITVVVAAGNDDDNAINHSPASEPSAITVSALADSDGICGGMGADTGLGADDSFATFSNHGEVVDFMAPGVNILSTWLDGGYNYISGTSMAASHVGGAAALYKAIFSDTTPEQVLNALINMASTYETKCNGQDGKGYLMDRSADDDDESEPLLYAKDLISTLK